MVQWNKKNNDWYFLTDAEAKDHHLADKVMETLREKHISVTFLLTSSAPGSRCNRPLDGPGYEVYEKISKETNGLILKLETSKIPKVMKTMYEAFDNNYLPIKV